MNIKSYILGVLTGIVLTIAVLFVIGLANQNAEESDDIQYLEEPVSYEGKSEASFKVLQVLGDAALAHEASEYGLYTGNTVMLLGEDFYSEQIVNIKNPKRVGSYSYTNNGGMPMTVPVIEGDTK